MSSKYDVLIIGAGIIGLATARHLLLRQKHLSVAVLEKEESIAKHQTGRNSGVIHSGIYYKPGSLKAQNCRKGVDLLLNYCEQKSIPIIRCGKVILATSEEELPRLEELYQRGKANGVPQLRKITPEELREIEPHAQALAVLHLPCTGIIDYTLVAHHYAQDIQAAGGEIRLGEKVVNIASSGKGWRIETLRNTYQTKFLINCAGFHADRIGHLSDKSICAKQIIPFRGEYYVLKPEKRPLVKGLIYPVPNPQFPFLGVHLSRTIDNQVEAGPNAVLAFSREGYFKSDVNIKDCLDYCTYSGFWRMTLKHWRIGCYEMYRSCSKRAFLKSLQRLIPELELDDLLPTDSGVRSQVVLPDGKLQDDFLMIEQPGLINVLNAPSPAATASLAIGEQIASRVNFENV